MKKALFAALAASLVFVSFAGCKKPAPADGKNKAEAAAPADTKADSQPIGLEDFWPGIVKIAVANDDDCVKSAEKLSAYFDVNFNPWADLLMKKAKEAKAAGKSDEEIAQFITEYRFPSEDEEKMMDALKCSKDDTWNRTLEMKAKPMLDKLDKPEAYL